MTAFICIDDGGGISFNNRRQSRDSAVIKDILSLSQNKVGIKKYSEPLFEDKTSYTVCDSHGECLFFFFENTDISSFYNDFDTVVLYHWNRAYPSDTVLRALPCECGFSLKECTEFKGSSHEKITREIYVK